MPPIKKYGSVQLHTDTLAALTVDPTVWLEGQPIFCLVAPDIWGLKIGDAVRLFPALPWVVNPYKEFPAPPFKVKNTDPNYSVVPNVVTGYDDTVITDARLAGQTNYIVTNNDNNVEFREDDLIYDPTNGKVTIKAFTLSNGSNISIFPNWANVAPAGIAAQIADLQKAAAPFLSGGGVVIWRRARILIPAGWQPAVSLAGKTILGYDPSDFATPFNLGDQGGSKTVSLTAKNNGPHSHNYQKAKSNGSASGNAVSHPDGPLETATTGNSGEGEPFSILNPYEIVDFIEMIP